MIYFEQRAAILDGSARRPGRPHPDAIRRNTVLEYRNSGGGYALISVRGGYQFIHTDEHGNDSLSRTYSSKLEALEAIYSDRLGRTKNPWGEAWLDRLLRDIAALKPLAEDTIHGRVKARFAKRLLTFYGDAELGYLIDKNFRGRYRFIHYSRAGEEVRSGFSTRLEALEAAYGDCRGRDQRYWGIPWASELLAEIEQGEDELYDDLLEYDDGLKKYADNLMDQICDGLEAGEIYYEPHWKEER